MNLIAEVEKKFVGTETVLLNEPQFDLTVRDERKTQARKFLAENGVDLSKTIIALGVGSANSRAKRWQAESYAKLNDKLQFELKANVVLVGASDELEVSNKVFGSH